jgi:Phospholipid methyltransferase
VDRGIYRWTRSPQYATLIPACARLALAGDSGPAFGLIALVAAVYVLMAYAEEPWLKSAYPGDIISDTPDASPGSTIGGARAPFSGRAGAV